MDMHRDGFSGEYDHTRGCLMCAAPPTRPVTYIRRTLAGGGWGNQNRPGLLWSWSHHPRSRAMHNRAASEGRAKRHGVINETARPRRGRKAKAALEDREGRARPTTV